MIQGYTGWPTGVNRIIEDSSNITLGENALKNDELENGLKRSRKRGAFCPDKFSVKMRFNWVDEVIINNQNTHKTEYNLFTDWYKYIHKYGSVPFEFPKILYSQDTGILIYDTVENGPINVEYYKITSAVPGNKSGDDIVVDTTWEAVYGGIVDIATQTPLVLGCSAKADYIDIEFSALGTTAPTSQMFTVYSGSTEGSTDNTVTIKGFYYDNANTVRIYYDSLASDTWVTFALNYPDYAVAAGTFNSEVP